MLCSPVEASKGFGEAYCFHLQGRTLSLPRNEHEENGMEAADSSETSINFYETTRRYFQEEGILHSHRSISNLIQFTLLQEKHKYSSSVRRN
jgi:hypothetical protein